MLAGIIAKKVAIPIEVGLPLNLKPICLPSLKTLLNSIERIFDVLKKNPQFGDPIRKELIPGEFIKQKIKNIYRLELSNYWRMIYTLEGNKIEILVFVLKIFDHKEYNKLFGYKK